MNVHDTIVHMMQTYPTLNPNRAAALNNLFNGSHAHWVNGELVLDEDSGYFDRQDWRDSLHEVNTGTATKEGTDVHMVIHYLRENAKIEFTVKYADLLAQDMHTELKRQQPEMYWISSYDDRWNDMPEDVTDEWAAAGEEIALEVYNLIKDCPKGTHAHNSCKLVKLFLMKRGKLKDDRQERIEQLRKELAELEGEDT